jgi:hypothetical protein
VRMNMLRQMMTKVQVESMLVDVVDRKDEIANHRMVAGLLMDVLGIPADWLDDVLKGGLDCDRCGRTFLACLAQVGLEEMVLCEECKIEEDPIIAMHEMLVEDPNNPRIAEVMDHRTDEDGITESFPIIVRLDD